LEISVSDQPHQHHDHSVGIWLPKTIWMAAARWASVKTVDKLNAAVISGCLCERSEAIQSYVSFVLILNDLPRWWQNDVVYSGKAARIVMYHMTVRSLKFTISKQLVRFLLSLNGSITQKATNTRFQLCSFQKPTEYFNQPVKKAEPVGNER
jgi:hypothetical protein